MPARALWIAHPQPWASLPERTKNGTRKSVSTRKRLPAVFFRTEAGSEPVREWLKSDGLSRDDRRRIGEDIKAVEFGWPIGMPTCRALRDGVWEVRTSLTNRIARVLFCVIDNRMLLLHGFIKKAQQTPRQDIALALQRKRQLESRK